MTDCIGNSLDFEYFEEFTDEIIDRIENDEDCFISVFAKYEQTCDFIKELSMYDIVKLDNVELRHPDIDGYTDEYIIDIWSADGIVYIGCEPAKRDGKYFNYEGDICYLFGDCNSRILKTCNYDEIYDVVVGEYEDDDCK